MILFSLDLKINSLQYWHVHWAFALRSKHQVRIAKEVSVK